MDVYYVYLITKDFHEKKIYGNHAFLAINILFVFNFMCEYIIFISHVYIYSLPDKL